MKLAGFFYLSAALWLSNAHGDNPKTTATKLHEVVEAAKKGGEERAEVARQLRKFGALPLDRMLTAEGVTPAILSSPLFSDEVETVVVQQGNGVYGPALGPPNPPPKHLENGSLRDRSSNTVWLSVVFKDGSQMSFTIVATEAELGQLFDAKNVEAIAKPRGGMWGLESKIGAKLLSGLHRYQLSYQGGQLTGDGKGKLESKYGAETRKDHDSAKQMQEKPSHR